MEPAMERLCWLPDAQRVHDQHELDGPVPATSSSQHLIPHALVRLRQSNDPEASNLARAPLEIEVCYDSSQVKVNILFFGVHRFLLCLGS